MNKLFLLPILLILTSCYEQECDCKLHKIGKFEFVQEIDGIKKITIFERTENLQIETYEGKKDSAEVRWVNDCEFVLQKLHPKNMQEQKAISMRILSTTQNSYNFEYSFVGSEKKEKGTARKL
ncbi:MAG: DNA topoisomerase IV [Flavobacterium sp.]|nr:DNA topoisomerase IV [Flavobacterium sp.]